MIATAVFAIRNLDSPAPREPVLPDRRRFCVARGYEKLGDVVGFGEAGGHLRGEPRAEISPCAAKLAAHGFRGREAGTKPCAVKGD